MLWVELLLFLTEVALVQLLLIAITIVLILTFTKREVYIRELISDRVDMLCLVFDLLF